MDTTRLRQLWLRLAPGPDVSWFDIALGVVLSAFAIALVVKYATPGPHGGVGTAIAVLTMTLPVIWRRRYPVGVAVVLFAGAGFNALVIGRMVRCGPCLPVLLFCAFALGRRDDVRDRRLIALGLGALIGSAAVQCCFDPNLQPVVLVALVPMIVGLFALGRLVSSHSAVVARLSERHEQLRRRRQETATLAARADRARIAESLDEVVRARIAEMAEAAEAGQDAARLSSSSAATQDAFATIERTGRETLHEMRQVVGTLLDAEPPKQPQPGLAELEQLAGRARGVDVHLHLVGQRRALPPGLELSAYRTVEHLLDAFSARPGGPVTITVDFGRDRLELLVRGPAPALVEQRAALAASKARIALHNGVLSSASTDGQWEALARLPLPAHV